MTTNLIEKLTKNLEAKTEAALGKLANLDAEITSAFLAAQGAAQAKINDRLQQIESDLTHHIHTFEERLADMAADAFELALQRLDQRIAELGTHLNGKPIPTPEAEAERLAEQSTREQERLAEEIASAQAELNHDKEDEQQEPAAVYQSSAAQVTEADRPGLVVEPEDDEDTEDGDDPDSDDEAAQEVPADLEIVHSAEGLYERLSERRYVPVTEPIVGGTYYVKNPSRKPSRWKAVVYFPQA